MTTLQLAAAALALVCGVGCNRATSEEGPLGATGDTDVRYVICAIGDTGCFVAARFNDLDSCNQYKQVSEMLCDRSKAPQVVTCKRDPGEQLAVSYCTK